MISIDDQISLLPQNEKNEIEEGRKVDHLINIPDTNGQDPLGSEIKKSVNQIFEEEFKYLDNSSIKSCTIFKVNVWLRESNPDAYTPKMVSIGPYHKKKSQLDPMKKYKLLYLRRFLKRKEGFDVKSCINELEELKEDALKCYDIDTDELEKLEKEALKCYDVKNDEFCQILLLDGCFVIEFIRERCEIRLEKDKIINSNIVDYIFRDLMLLENQLPFFVLNKLHDMTRQDDESPLAILVGILFPFFVDLPEMTLKSFMETRECYNIKHFLHLVHKLSCHGNHKKKSGNNDDSTWYMFMPNATELSEAGVSFEKVSVTKTLFDSIEFEKGLMKLPCFDIEDDTEIFLRNLIAYEQQSVDLRPKNFSNFAIFMDHLIDSDKDVNLLRQKGMDRRGQRVTNLFNKIGNGVLTYSDFYYKEECEKIVKHCKKPWNRMKANLMHNYFSSPWVGASTVAAIILLILTAIQTILAFIK